MKFDIEALSLWFDWSLFKQEFSFLFPNILTLTLLVLFDDNDDERADVDDEEDNEQDRDQDD